MRRTRHDDVSPGAFSAPKTAGHVGEQRRVAITREYQDRLSDRGGGCAAEMLVRGTSRRFAAMEVRARELAPRKSALLLKIPARSKLTLACG
jgi:hypothetical protein